MADRATERRWLEHLTAIPTAPGHESRVMAWVEAWAARRPDLKVERDRHGNLFLTQRRRSRKPPVLAVAHTDHPGFVVEGVDGRTVHVEFRGGVRSEYFDGARVEFFSPDGGGVTGDLTEYDPGTSRGVAVLDRPGDLGPGAIGRWSLDAGGGSERLLEAPACDDLAGAAAALAGLDRARAEPGLGHVGVLLTRAEEVGFVGAIGACRDRSVPIDARILSIECSRSFPDSPLGAGPIVRVGDRSSVFDHRLTNLVADAADRADLPHQRKLMAGGSCEATAFVAYGYQATGLCLALDNYHNMGHLTEVEAGRDVAVPRLEVIDLEDFHGLVRLLVAAAGAVDGEWNLVERLDARFDESARVLS